MMPVNAKSRTKTEAVKITPEQRIVLAYLSEETGKSRSNLIYEALTEKYDFEKLFPIARSFFESSVRLIKQTPEQPQ
jgi:predicted DNA-binding protein